MLVKNCLLKKFLMVLAALFVSSNFSASAETVKNSKEDKIIEIRVQVNRKIETSTILAKIGSKTGSSFSPEQVSKDIDSVFSLGFFKDVQVDSKRVSEGIILAFIVSEKPIIKSVTVKGNKIIEIDKIKKEITLVTGTILSRKEIENSIKKIKALYQGEGYYLAEISQQQKPLPQNGVEVILNIKEGNKVTLKRIIIEGNKAFSDKQIKDVMETKEDWIFAWATSAGDFKEDIFKKDLQKIDSLYQDNGYMEVEIGEPRIELSSDKKNIYLIIPVKEGRQFKIGRIDIQGNTLFSDKEVTDTIGFKRGSVFNRGKLENGIIALSDLHAQKGYLFADIIPMRKFPKDLPIINLNFNIDKGEKYYVGRIDITGNYKTRDKVIRRELTLAEGDPVNSLQLRQSREDMYALGYFNDIKVKTKRGEGRKNLDIEMNVEERPTGSLSFGAGFSSAENIVGMISVSEDNLFGKGWKISLSAQLSSRATEFDLSFTNPWLLDKPISAGIDIYNKRAEDFSNKFSRQETGGRLRFGFRAFERVWAFIAPRLGTEKISNVDSDASKYIQQFKGSQETRSILYSFTRDTRNHPLFPNKGTRYEISYEHAGAFMGGDIYFYRLLVDASKYFPVWWDTSFLLHGGAGYVESYYGRTVPEFERFKLGGTRTVRGFKNEEIGPEDANGNNIGGNKEIILNVEYIIPVLPQTFQFITFFDAGGAVLNGQSFSSGTIRKSVGIGVRLFLPIGPVRVDLGYKLDRKKGESPTQFHFGVGGQFY